ncbi:MAG: hypothetical protein AB8B69_18785 [Chitinophagales bacterium]
MKNSNYVTVEGLILELLDKTEKMYFWEWNQQFDCEDFGLELSRVGAQTVRVQLQNKTIPQWLINAVNLQGCAYLIQIQNYRRKRIDIVGIDKTLLLRPEQSGSFNLILPTIEGEGVKTLHFHLQNHHFLLPI